MRILTIEDDDAAASYLVKGLSESGHVAGDVARPGTTLRSWLPRAVLLGRIQPAGRY